MEIDLLKMGKETRDGGKGKEEKGNKNLRYIMYMY